DQHRADHLSCYGNTVLETPHIDRIADQGATFEQCYVATPAGMPNRASLLTGRMPSLHGVRYDGIPLDLRNVTFVDLLAAHGYRTALVGTAAFQNTCEICAESAAPGGEAVRHRGRYDRELVSRWESDQRHELDLPYYGFRDVALVCEQGDLASGHYGRWLAQRHPRPETLRGPRNALGDATFSVFPIPTICSRLRATTGVCTSRRMFLPAVAGICRRQGACRRRCGGCRSSATKSPWRRASRGPSRAPCARLGKRSL
ncbi:MAG: sulfatase-like hydrolase/transferase, partial [Gammaproteobacteria bacterium]